MNEEEKENYLYYIFGTNVSVPFEKIEKILIEEPHMISLGTDIESILSAIIIKALRMPDPIKDLFMIILLIILDYIGETK